MFAAFDPEVADVAERHPRRSDAVLLSLLSVALLTAMTVLGATLVAAAVVIPAATARLWTSSFSSMLRFSSMLGAGGGLAGMVGSYHLDITSRPTIVVVHTLGFGVRTITRRGKGHRPYSTVISPFIDS